MEWGGEKGREIERFILHVVIIIVCGVNPGLRSTMELQPSLKSQLVLFLSVYLDPLENKFHEVRTLCLAMNSDISQLKGLAHSKWPLRN